MHIDQETGVIALRHTDSDLQCKVQYIRFVEIYDLIQRTLYLTAQTNAYQQRIFLTFYIG